MQFFHDPARERQQKLDKFRQSFLLLIADGSYPPDRQNRLFHACQRAGLDWQEARRFVVPEALNFLRGMVRRVAADGHLTALEVANLRRLQRRLGLADEDAAPALERLYNLVERKLEALVLERAAYLSAAPLVAILTDEIKAYELPAERENRLVEHINRQHQLAKLMAGELPIVRPGVDLYPGEVCHLDMPASLLLEQQAARFTASGRLVATSLRLLLLSKRGGFAAQWAEVQTIKPNEASISIEAGKKNAIIIAADTQYIATLLAAARRKYNPAPAATPRLSNKRLT